MKAVLLIPLCVAFALAAQTKKQPKQKPPDPANGQTIVFENSQKSGDNPNKAEANNGTPWYTKSDWWVVIVAALTGGAIVYQAREMTTSTRVAKSGVDVAIENVKAMKAKERARLHVAPKDGQGFNDFDNVESSIFGTSAGIEITQHGPTKAFNVSGKICVVVTASKLGEPAEPKDVTDMEVPSVIEGNSLPITAQTMVLPFLTAQADAISQGESFLHMFGILSYEDVFGDKQRTTFRYLWVPDEYFEIPELAEEEGKRTLVTEAHWERNGDDIDNYAS